MSNEVTRLRLALRANGYSPIPVRGKEALLPEWQTKSNADEAEITEWASRHRRMSNTGILTEKTTTIDADITLPEPAEAIDEFVRDQFADRGELLCRFGNAPKRAFLFQTDAPFSKLVAEFKAPDGSDQKIEILCEGQQVVVDGIHPDTKQPYRWHADRSPITTPWDRLPKIDEPEAQAFLELASEILCKQFGFAPVTTQKRNGRDAHSPFGDATAVDIGAELEALNEASTANAGGIANEVHCRIIPSRLRMGEHPGDLLECVVDETMARAGNRLGWTRTEEVKCVTRRILSAYRNLLLRDYDPDFGTIPVWLPGDFHEAWLRVLTAGGRPMMHFNRGGFCIRGMQGTAANNTATEDAPPGVDSNGGTEGQKQEKRTRGTFVLRPFIPFDPALLPPRQWLYGRHYQRGTVSATIAPGGFGKTTLCMVEAVAMATCRNLLDEQPTERLRVWYHNGEDSLEELNRRLGAICLHYGIPQEELRNWFFMTSGNEVPLRVANGYSDLKIHELLIKCIAQEIAHNEVDVAMLDPLVTLHSVPEGDNSKMDAVVRIFASIADAQDCAIELTHHTRKLAPGITDYVANDIRGASAIKDAVRAARMLNQMTDTDADAVGVPEHERTSYFRVDRVKGNNAPPAKAVWRRFVNVELPNTDEVGVVVPWDFPGQGTPSPEMTAAEQAADALFMQLLVRLTMEGRTVSDKAGTNYAPHVFSQEREAKAAKIGKRPLADAMRRLFANKRIRVDHRDQKGRVVYCLVAA